MTCDGGEAVALLRRQPLRQLQSPDVRGDLFGTGRPEQDGGDGRIDRKLMPASRAASMTRMPWSRVIRS